MLCALPPTVNHAVDNPARVAPGQRKYITFPEGQRFAPIRPAPSGELLLSVEPGECWLRWAVWLGRLQCHGLRTHVLAPHVVPPRVAPIPREGIAC